MILDNASWHKKAKRLIWEDQLPEYANIREKVKFLDIPPYSPDSESDRASVAHHTSRKDT